jgi:PAS domain S-box-containing protein
MINHRRILIVYQIQEITDEIQKTAEAIASVLKLEVTVYDKNFTVVASTGGGMHSKIGTRVRGHVINEAIKTKSIVFNDKPGMHHLCKGCVLKGACPERASISCPIVLDDDVVGVLGLTAFDENQQQSILEQKNALHSFLEKMTDLIKSKLAEYQLVKKLSSTLKELETIINCVNEGILFIDINGNIAQMNDAAENLFGLDKNVIKHTNIDKIIPNLPLKQVINSKKGYTDWELTLNVNGKTINAMSTAQLVRNDDSIIGVVFTFRDMKDVNKLVYEMSSYQENYYFKDICTNNQIMLQIKQKAHLVAQNNSTVLIQGESGTGKELFARAIHSESARKDGPFITINCAAIPDNLLESELFGYEGGAFTGAQRKGKPGKFELANGGTIFLDEIGDMSLHLQAKLLRVLEDKKIDRVGGVKPISINVRVIAATNQNLEQMIVNGEFREDLFYRLNVIPIIIPPLRQRLEDIPLLAEHFIQKYSRIFGKKGIVGLSGEALKALMEYNWPGNVRELENAIEYAFNMEVSDRIQRNSLPIRIATFDNKESGWGIGSVMNLDEMEKSMILKAIRSYGNSVDGKKMAAKALGIDISTLYRKLKKINP